MRATFTCPTQSCSSPLVPAIDVASCYKQQVNNVFPTPRHRKEQCSPTIPITCVNWCPSLHKLFNHSHMSNPRSHVQWKRLSAHHRCQLGTRVHQQSEHLHVPMA